MPAPLEPEDMLVGLDQVEVACLCPCPTHGLQGVHREFSGMEHGDSLVLRSGAVTSKTDDRVEFVGSDTDHCTYGYACAPKRFCGAEQLSIRRWR